MCIKFDENNVRAFWFKIKYYCNVFYCNYVCFFLYFSMCICQNSVLEAFYLSIKHLRRKAMILLLTFAQCTWSSPAICPVRCDNLFQHRQSIPVHYELYHVRYNNDSDCGTGSVFRVKHCSCHIEKCCPSHFVIGRLFSYTLCYIKII